MYNLRQQLFNVLDPVGVCISIRFDRDLVPQCRVHIKSRCISSKKYDPHVGGIAKPLSNQLLIQRDKSRQLCVKNRIRNTITVNIAYTLSNKNCSRSNGRAG